MFDQCLYFNVNRLARALNRLWDDAYSELDLAPAHAYLLRLLLTKPGLIQKQIAEELHLDKSTVNRFVDKMAKEGYLYRDVRNEDGRMAIFPTEQTECLRLRLNEIDVELDSAMRTLLGTDLKSDVIDRTRNASARL